jgi:hypothetical protein
MMRTQKRSVRTAAMLLGAAAVLGIAAAPAFAGGAQASNGFQAAIDPATRQLRQPTAEESRDLAARLTAKALPGVAKVTQWADGTLSMVLTEEYQNVWIVGLNADGTVSQICVDGYDAVTATPSATPAFEER